MQKLVKTTKLSKQGQVTLPKSAIKSLGLNVDQLVNLEITNDSVIITKKPNPVAKYIGILKGKIDLTSKEYLEIRKKEAGLK